MSAHDRWPADLRRLLRESGRLHELHDPRRLHTMRAPGRLLLRDHRHLPRRVPIAGMVMGTARASERPRAEARGRRATHATEADLLPAHHRMRHVRLLIWDEAEGDVGPRRQVEREPGRPPRWENR